MLRILVVDDASLMRETVREIVGADDFDIVAEARDGAEAVRKFDALRPDVVLLDLLLPKLSGTETLEAILLLDPGACVVVCSALGQEPLAADALARGARDVVVKPFHPEGLLSTLERLARKRLVPAA